MKKFNQNISEQFTSFSVKMPNEAKSKKNIHADYVELVCLFSNDYISQSDVIDRMQDSGDEFELPNPTDGDIGLIDAQRNDSAEKFINTVFEFIEERKTIYQNTYPFETDTEKGIKLKEKTSLTEQQRLYLYLLIASSLNSFRKLQSNITSEFETLSETVLKSYLPTQARVLNFANNTVYHGNTKEKIKQLAKEINLECNNEEIEQISENNSKEEGLDIVAWIPFEDKNPNTIIILGQCACGKNWFGKQNETLRYENYLRPYKQPFTHSVFMPYDLKNTKGRFGLSKDITTNHLIFERRRILNLANNDIFDNLKYSKQIIDKCLEYQEDVV
jgi:hypothetical protein